MLNPDFNKVIYFLKTVECGSFSEAARALYISPQALNKQVSLLESELGEKLFARSTRAIEMTEFGKFFHSQMDPIYQLYEIAIKDTKHYLELEEQTFKIAFFQGMSKRRVVLPVMNELMAQLPDINMELRAAEMDRVLADVRSGRADMAVSYMHEYESVSDLECISLLKVPVSVVISYYHPWMVKEHITADDMADMPVLFLEREGGPDTAGVYGRLKASKYRFASSYNSLLARLETGKEYAVFPAAFENLKEDGFKALNLPLEYAFHTSITLLYRKDNKYAKHIATLALLSGELEKNGYA